MESMSIDRRNNLSIQIKKQLNDMFNSGSRARLELLDICINGNMPSNVFGYKKDKDVNASFGFAYTITPLYMKRFNEGEIDSILEVFKTIMSNYSRIYYKVYKKGENDTCMTVYCIGFREPDEEDNCMQVDILQPMPTK